MLIRTGSMKKIILSLAVSFFLFSGFAYSQLKIGYVDSKTIMSKFPDAVDANRKLDVLIKDWQTEINKMKLEKQEKRRLSETETDYDGKNP